VCAGKALREMINSRKTALENLLLTGILEFPSDDAVPLVEFERKVAMAPNPLGVICEAVTMRDLKRRLNIQGYIAVSDVGRMAIGSSRSELPLKQHVRKLRVWRGSDKRPTLL